jgi:peptidoglycan/LPS O-acetylase OafA/YrhL
MKPVQGGALGPSLPKTRHLALIDQLRCLAIIVVVFHHLMQLTFSASLPWVDGVRDFHAYGAWSWLSHFFYVGWTGVSLFFVLSGFCIHWSCLRWQRFNARRFFWQRFWRIYPTYFVALIILSWIELRGYSSLVAARQVLTHAFMIHNFSTVTFWGINGPFWSVAAEGQLYLLYPLLLVMKRRLGWRGCFLLAGFLSLAWCAVTVLLWGLPLDVNGPALDSPLVTWVDWILGAWVAEQYANGRRAFPKNSALVWAALLGFLASTVYRPLIPFSFFLAALTSALWLDQLLHRHLATASQCENAPLTKRITVWIGLISYSLYVWHEPILIHWHKWISPVIAKGLPFGMYALLALAAPLTLVIAAAYISYQLF